MTDRAVFPVIPQTMRVMVSGGLPGPDDDITQVRIKHLPGQHDQKDHTPKAYRGGASTAPSDVGLEYVDDAAMAYIAGSGGYLTDVIRNAELLGDSTGDVDRAGALIFNWQQSAGDKNSKSLGLQQAASDEFGVAMSEHHKLAIENVRDADAFSDARRDGGGLLRAMYDNTQKDLAEAGIDKVVLYRGVTYTGDDATRVGKMSPGDKTNFTSNALESWSVDPERARLFAGDGVGTGMVLQVEVPASKVMSTQRTGIGYANDNEFVLLGSPADEPDVARVVEVL